MGLGLILGSSGTGKSRYALEQLIRHSMDRPAGRFFFIVPEQYTMEMQREMVRRHPRGGSMNLDVISFHRLAFRVLAEQNVQKLTLLDDLGKSMLLRRALRRHRNELTVFRRQTDKAGFFDQIKSTLSELFQYGVTEEDLDRMIEASSGRPALSRKLADIRTAYRAFREELSEDTIPSEELLGVLAGMAPASELLRDAEIVLDGFTGFTPLQYKLIEQLLTVCREITVTVTIDPQAVSGPVREEDLFALSRQTVDRLRRLGRESGIVLRPDVIMTEDHRFDRPALHLLEQRLMRSGSAVPPARGETDGLRLCVCSTPAEEARLCAAAVLRLCREEGLTFREIGVVCSDLTVYRSCLEDALTAAQIPYFIDVKEHLSDHPAVSLIQSALEAVTKGWTYDAVLRFARSLFSPLTQTEADELDRYALAMGLSGRKKWDAPFEKSMQQLPGVPLERLNGLRERVTAPLLLLQEGLSAPTAEGKARGLVAFFESLSLWEKLEEERLHLEETGQMHAASVTGQVYRLLLELLDRLVDVLGEEEMSAAEFCDVLATGFSESKAGLIPERLDRLVIGDMERTRLGAVRALIFLGLNDGMVPRSASRHRLITDRDRQLLADLQVELSPAARQNAYIQRFYLYLTLTKAGHEVILTYAETSAEGRELLPSPSLREIRRAVPGLAPHRVTPEELYASEKSLRRPMLDQIRRLREGGTPDADGRVLLSWFRRNRPDLFAGMIRASLSGYHEERLSRACADRLYGPVLSGSISRLESYASCAFAEFVSGGLGLKPMEEKQFGAADLGSLYHQCIEVFFTQLVADGADPRAVTEEERKRRTADAVRIVTESFGHGMMTETASMQYRRERIRRVIDRTVWALLSQLAQGSYRPYASEMKFAPQDAASLRLPIGSDRVMLLKGRIDRLDIAETGDSVLVRIVDYKSGRKKIEDEQLYPGLQLQLPVYLKAACEVLEQSMPGKVIVPAMMEYVPVDDPIVEGPPDLSEEELGQLLREQLAPKAMMLGSLASIEAYDRQTAEALRADPGLSYDKAVGKENRLISGPAMSHLLGFVQKRSQELGRGISEGRIPVDPYKRGDRTACTYCPYRIVCGFDPRRPGFTYRRLPQPDPEEIYGKEDPHA